MSEKARSCDSQTRSREGATEILMGKILTASYLLPTPLEAETETMNLSHFDIVPCVRCSKETKSDTLHYQALSKRLSVDRTWGNLPASGYRSRHAIYPRDRVRACIIEAD